LEAALEHGCVSDAIVAESMAQAKALWHIRESIPLAQAEEGLNIKHDISIGVSRIPDFLNDANADLLRRFPGARLVTYGHLGDGNLHYNVQAPEHDNAERFLLEEEDAMNALVFEWVDRYQGSISAEHGIGSLKVHKLSQHKSPVALGLMKTIKQALDPLGLMNPGRVLEL
jgi:FAD/FMN-containing dehydrogenase